MPVLIPIAFRARALYALALFAFGAAVPAAAQPPAVNEDARVVVSRREVRVVFPPEPAGPWRWTARDLARNEATFGWTMHLDSAVGGPRSMSLTFVSHERVDGVIHTLAELVDTAWTSVCGGGMVNPCTFRLPTARVEDGRVVLVLRDSAEIVRMFGLRPSHVQVRREHLAREWSEYDSVRVEYVSPAIPAPDPALLARATQERLAYEASVNSYQRRIATWGNDDTPTLWVAVGDTLILNVRETHCHYDYCSMPAAVAVRDGGWSVEDTSIARLQPLADPGTLRDDMPQRLISLRPGSTRIRATGIHSPADTLPGGDLLPRTVTREVIVRNPVGRVELTASDTLVAVGQTVTIRADAFDTHGRRIDGAPVRMQVEIERYTRVQTGPDPFAIGFPAPGRYPVTGLLESAADTVVITVLPAPSAAAPRQPEAEPASGASTAAWRPSTRTRRTSSRMR